MSACSGSAVRRTKRSAPVMKIRRRIGIPTRPHDRYLLEQVIFPALRRRPDFQRFLFVGCDEFTEDYPARFADRRFVTIDVDPEKARFGAREHIVDSFTNVAAHFGPASLDAVICNGVFGWGLDDPVEIDQAVDQTYNCLRPGGIFIVGWNDVGPWRPASFDDVEGFARFAPLSLEPFDTPVYRTLGPLRHVYNFYVRES